MRPVVWRIAVLVILDPVLLSSSGAELASQSTREAVVAQLLPRATLVTPNLYQGAALLGAPIADVATTARELRELGARAVLIKGGHATDATGSRDYFFDGDRGAWIVGPRYPYEDFPRLC